MPKLRRTGDPASRLAKRPGGLGLDVGRPPLGSLPGMGTVRFANEKYSLFCAVFETPDYKEYSRRRGWTSGQYLVGAICDRHI